MNWLEADIMKVRELSHKQDCTIFWFEGGGGEVHKIWDMYFLFEIPQYGGEGRFEGAYDETQIEELVRKAHTWT